MNASKYLIAFTIAVSITTLEFVGLSILADRAGQLAHNITVPGAAIPVLPEIRVQPTPAEVRAAFAGNDLASTTSAGFTMPFYSFAVKPVIANKG